DVPMGQVADDMAIAYPRDCAVRIPCDEQVVFAPELLSRRDTFGVIEPTRDDLAAFELTTRGELGGKRFVREAELCRLRRGDRLDAIRNESRRSRRRRVVGAAAPRAHASSPSTLSKTPSASSTCSFSVIRCGLNRTERVPV